MDGFGVDTWGLICCDASWLLQEETKDTDTTQQLATYVVAGFVARQV